MRSAGHFRFAALFRRAARIGVATVLSPAQQRRHVGLENGSRDVHTLSMVGGQTREDQPPSHG